MIDKLKEISSTTRVRFILILLVVQLLVVFLSLGTITITSQPNFCNICHEMRADVQAWKSSAHAEVTCYSCHSEGGILAFLGHKVSNLKEPYYHLTNKFEKPINADGKYAREMSNEPCKRCHTLNRKVTPSKILIIDHQKHEEKKITCVTCHNRVGHPNMRGYLGEKAPEEAKAIQVSLDLGEEQSVAIESIPYEDHMKMRFCMACHTGEKGKGPRECRTCHPSNLELKPTDHRDPAWLLPQERLQQVRALHGREARVHMRNCLSCHQQKECRDCHKTEIPHPAKWKKEHSKVGTTTPEDCVRCHRQPNFCAECHHRKYDLAQGPWYSSEPGLSVHPLAVRREGASNCFNCHSPVYCAHCHVRGTKLPY